MALKDAAGVFQQEGGGRQAVNLDEIGVLNWRFMEHFAWRFGFRM